MFHRQTDRQTTNICTANEWPVRIQYKCLVPIYVFLEMKLLFSKQNYNVKSPSSYTRTSVRDLFISWIDLPILPQGKIWTILGIYKSLTDTWMWKLGLRPRNSQKKNTWMGFSLQCGHNVKILFSKTLTSNIRKKNVYHEIAIFVLHITCGYKVLTYVEYRAVSGVFQYNLSTPLALPIHKSVI